MNKQISISSDFVFQLVEQLPIELKRALMEKLAEQLTDNEAIDNESYLPNYDIEGWNEPINLDKYALNSKALPALQELWKDEPPAEELIEMLTK